MRTAGVDKTGMVAGETLPGAREVKGVKSSPAVLPEPVVHIRAVVRLALGCPQP